MKDNKSQPGTWPHFKLLGKHRPPLLLVDVVHLDDEGWQDYMKGSLINIPFVYDGEGALEIDPEGNPFYFKYSEVAFIFDRFCSCFDVMNGEWTSPPQADGVFKNHNKNDLSIQINFFEF